MLPFRNKVIWLRLGWCSVSRSENKKRCFWHFYKILTFTIFIFERMDTHSVSFLTAYRLTADTTRPLIHSATTAHSIAAFDSMLLPYSICKQPTEGKSAGSHNCKNHSGPVGLAKESCNSLYRPLYKQANKNEGISKPKSRKIARNPWRIK
uniref:Uncharacterized protein n=1 Tax=Vicia faba TaxID=3906 RepID=R4IU81_VICFA|nr:hypothetical protein [Vicia faba]